MPEPIKPATTFEEQISKLKSRGLIIRDEDFALQVLKRVNYYRFTGYLLPYKLPSGEYARGTSFDTIYRTYDFDQNLRNLLIRQLDSIEISIRTKLSYFLAHKYGPLGYEDISHFKPNTDKHGKLRHETLLERLKEEFDRGVQKGQLFALHHHQKYGSRLPIWVAVELMSFGDLSTLYSIMLDDDQAQISNEHFSLQPVHLASWLRTLRYIRNSCAHHERLYDLTLDAPAKLHRKEKKRFSNQKVFSAVYICGRLMDSQTDLSRFIARLDALVSEYSGTFKLEISGFPPSWREILDSINTKYP